MSFDNSPNPEDLVQAAGNGKLDFVKHLLSVRVDVDYHDRLGLTAMHLATRNGHTEVVKYLVNFGADIDCKNNRGDTPLILATKEDNLELVEFLVGHGAEVNLQNLLGKIAVDYAYSSEVKKMLHDRSFFGVLNGDKKTSWNRSRLMVVGQGRAGKTATVRALLGKTFMEDTASTIGASVSESKISKSADLWDEIDPLTDEVNYASKFAARIIHELSLENENKRPRWKEAQRKAVDNSNRKSETEQDRNDAEGSLKHGKELYNPRVTHVGLTPIARRTGRRTRRTRLNLRGTNASGLNQNYYSRWLAGNIPGRNKEKFMRPFEEDLILEAKSSKDEITMSVWDFGGQDVFYSMHHIFLTKSGVYLLVVDLREVSKPGTCQQALHYVAFWLRSVTLHAPMAPILIAGTFAMEFESTEALTKLSKILEESIASINANVFANIEDGLVFFPIENSNSSGVNTLRLNIESAIREDESINQEVSMKWILLVDEILTGGKLRCPQNSHLLKEHKQKYLRTSSNVLNFTCDVCKKEPAVETLLYGCRQCDHDICESCADEEHPDRRHLKEGYVPLSVIKKIAVDVGVKNAKEQESALDFFHERGMLIHLNSTEELRNVVITDPQFLVLGLSKVIRDNRLHQYDPEEMKRVGLEDDMKLLFADALATQDFLEYVWGNDHVRFFTDLMKQTMLLSEWNFGEERSFLVPSLLKDSFQNEDRTGIRAVFDFSEKFLPLGVFERLVCLCVGHSALCRRMGDDIRTPDLCKHEAYIEFEPGLLFHLKENADSQTITLYIEDESVAAKSVHMIETMLRKLNDDMMGSGLKWDILVEDITTDRKLVRYTKAKESGLAPWFTTNEHKSFSMQEPEILDVSSFLDGL